MTNKKMLKGNKFKNFAFSISKIIPTIALAYTISFMPVYSQEIIPDGNTNTILNYNSGSTNISTTTIKGNNAFNSFEKFNVNLNNTVNLHVPSSSENLINLIHSEHSNINGILNSIKDNKVGGNIFIVNPYGVTVGPQGVINVGSLTISTPTTDYMNKFFDSPGNPNNDSVINLLEGKSPVNPDANIFINGAIKAINNVQLDSGNIVNTGNISTGNNFDELSINDLVNVNDLKTGDVINNNGNNITIKAKNDFTNLGNILADGNNNINAGDISITADNNIYLEPDSYISAKGNGINSNAGNIFIYANKTSKFEDGSYIDVSGGTISGDAGHIELSATDSVELNGGLFKATATNGNNGSVLIDPENLFLTQNFYTDGADYTFEGTNSV
ncbi:MAG: leukotoxin LktA family filamentous adhesin, partial [Cyanobacteriota bacterium]